MFSKLEKSIENMSKFRKWIYSREKKVEKEEKMLLEHEEVMKILKKMENIPERLSNLEENMIEIHSKMDDLTIGLQKELLTSLRTLRDQYVSRGWCTALEKEEYESIYNVYHEKLHGNHTATRYLTEILALPTEEIK